jgi:hypothetical protein
MQQSANVLLYTTDYGPCTVGLHLATVKLSALFNIFSTKKS